MEENSVISILSAMITPAVLILASGSLSLTTSQRLSRSIDRSRKLFKEILEIQRGEKTGSDAEVEMLRAQLKTTAKRAKLMQKAMSMLYVALGLFITTSLLIGIFDVMEGSHPWITLILAMTGSLSLLSAAILLILESRLALASVNNEMDYLVFKNEVGEG